METLDRAVGGTPAEQGGTANDLELIRPDAPSYDLARQVYNGLIDRRPALIARCRDADGIVDAIALVRGSGLEVSIRGGGHNVAGDAVVEGGLMVDLSQMKRIEVDPAGRRARVQPGVTWKELNAATQAHGLAVTGGVISTTGVAGLTLGGGIGSIMGAYGLAADNLVSARLVTADGRVLTVSPEEHPDLHWALRGGGGNFGVVSEFDFGLHQLGPNVFGGIVFHRWPAAGDVLRRFRDRMADAPDELTVGAALVQAPDGSGQRLAGLIICHIGEEDAAERDVRPLLELGAPVQSHVGRMRYRVVNSVLDRVYPWGSLNYWKSSFLEDLSDEAIEALLEAFAGTPSPMTTILIERFHGAVTRVPVDATAFPHRAPGYNVSITSIWRDPEATEPNVAWTRAAFGLIAPFRAPGRYLNYLSEDDTGDAVARAAFGPNLERLRRVKSAYDPDDIFHGSVRIAPTR